MDNDIDRFAQTNFHNFFPKEKKAINVRLISIVAGILGSVALYYYLDNKRKEKYIEMSFREIKRLQNKIDADKKDATEGLQG